MHRYAAPAWHAHRLRLRLPPPPLLVACQELGSGQNGVVLECRCTLPGVPHRKHRLFAVKIMFNFGVVYTSVRRRHRVCREHTPRALCAERRRRR